MRSDSEGGVDEDDEVSPIEEVRLTVSNTDDPTQPIWTFRTWFLGLLSCSLLSFLNQILASRRQSTVLNQIGNMVITFPLGHFMAAALPTTKFTIPGFGSKSFSFNPGPFNMKEHVLIAMFANAGCQFGAGSPYVVSVVDAIKFFYRRNISFTTSWLLILTTQTLGFGWAGLMRKYVVEPAHMWWPDTLAQVSVFRLYENIKTTGNTIGNHKKINMYEEGKKLKEKNITIKVYKIAFHEKDEHRVSRTKFFFFALLLSLSWYAIPGFFFTKLSTISWVCWIFPKSVIAQQIGSGLSGFGVGALTLDWAAVSSFLFSPLVSPFFAIVNVFVGYALMVYAVIPIAYWGLNVYNANRFPIFSSHFFTVQGQRYNISAIVDNRSELNVAEYEKQGRIHLSVSSALTYGFGFATVASTLTHVFCFHGREIMERYRASSENNEDIHAKLMRRYKDIPSWWFHSLLVVTLVVSLALCIFLNDQVQMPWWGLLLAVALALGFTLPVSIITATTNQTTGLNIIAEYVFGLIYPGKPIANVCFKTYGYISMVQAVFFLDHLKVGHYMKIPPRSVFLVQFIGTMLAGTINIGVLWWLLNSIKNICREDLLPADSPWTCPTNPLFFDASVIWGVVGPKRIFGSEGNYSAMNWFFLGGALGPIIVWVLHKAFPKQSWIPLINLPVLLGAAAVMQPITPLNYNAWILVGTIFNFFIFRYRKKWWQRYNYVLSAALDSGVVLMTILLYSLRLEIKSPNWWGNDGEHCPLAACPTAKGVIVDGCPTN
ncbi:Oligopeptide transporter [Vigna unguiculata]|uniref:Oligopeptide transporter n=1 Tax=Vigna unguiculata TaxID=3917 RepID=A0A4D6KFW8_VIGUN|nr:Oligopeptide transporter [Vigna unguiculata]